MDEVAQAYRTRAAGLAHMFGTTVSPQDPDRAIVEVARKAHPTVPFRQASIAALAGSDERWAGILAMYSLIHLGPGELPSALSTLRGVLADDGSLLVSFFSGPRVEAFEHPATTAFRWPMGSMARALEEAGFDVVDGRWHPRRPHAAMTALPRPSAS